MTFEIVACMCAQDSLVHHYLMPIALHPEVSRLWIVRPRKSLYGDIPKSEYVLAPARFRIFRFIRMIMICFKLGARKEVGAFVSFNPFPYGFIAYLAARWHNKPVHFGFIGSDWYRHIKGKFGRFLLPIAKKASFITATGELMRTEMLELGLDAEKIKVLPHSVDLDRMKRNEPEKAKYDCIYVGQLIERKRVDLILQGFAKVSAAHPEARLCIVGDGPLRGSLENMARRLGIADAVDFAGFRIDVERYLADSRIILIASNMEGLPFAMIEGMCSGLAPVCTPVGTIPNLIKDGVNGLLFPCGDANALADCVNRLIENPLLYETIRKNAIQARKIFSYESATALWDDWFRSISTRKDLI